MLYEHIFDIYNYSCTVTPDTFRNPTTWRGKNEPEGATDNMKTKILAAIATASIIALTALILQPFPHTAAHAQTGEKSASFQLLSAVLADADAKGTLSDALNNLLADMFIEYLIAPQTGETVQQARTRLTVQGQSSLQFLNAVLADADDKGTLSDALNDLLADVFIENLISPQTGETVQQARARLSAPADAGSPTTDRAALIALYNATDGPNWENNTNWDTDEPLGEWHGVTTDANGRVTRLVLRGREMSGEIPSELGNLSDLTDLRLYRSQLSGPIPPELGKLTNLTVLYLYRNQLSGPIPPDLGNLTNLQWLYLYLNQLSGPIPSELGNLSDLQGLSLSRNQLSGTIPPELGNLANLESLYLRDNQLTGCIPNTLGNTLFNDLSELSLPFCSPRVSNPADKAILEAFYNATGGPDWSNNANWLSDKPTSLWYGVATDSDGRVTSLRLGTNELSGSIPSELGDLTNLEFMALDGNELSGEIPPELGDLANLKRLYLNENQLSGSIPTQLGKLTNLETLHLWGNELSGQIPAELGKLTKLEALALSGNRLSGSIPAELGKLSKLEALALQYNQLSGALPQSLTSITGLETFHFGDNNGLCSPTDAAFVDWLQAIPTWSGPDCDQVKAIASDRAALVALDNATDGPNWSTTTNWGSDKPLGQWYGVRTNQEGRVTGLWLQDNRLSGPIPPELGNLSNLTFLDLQNNQLSGGIPPELGNLTGLTFLGLYGNDLEGPVPSELGKLTNLTYLNLSNNQLTGALPQALTKITGLEDFYFGYNDGLCSPTDAAFVAWFQNIPGRGGVSCGDPDDRAALVALYNATDGPNWSTSTNWLSDKPIGEWYRVGTDETGRVDWLGLWENGLSGTIPTQLGNLTSLKSLNLGENQLSGSIPSELGNLTNLGSLSLDDNQLSGAIPPELGNLTKLTWLNLSNNQLTGALPQALTKITGLEDFYFGYNDGLCSPTDAAFVAWLQAIPDWGGPSCGNPADRAALVALYNATDGPNWTNSDNWLSDKPLEDWYNVGTDDAGRVDWLVLDNNGLSGTIPTQLGNLAKLKTLELGYNNLSGSIPSQLGNLTNLDSLGLADNQLTGNIPSQLGKLTNLESLGLSENNLAGPIPSGLGNLSRLTYVNLHSNQLSGTIPSQLGNMANLEHLLLHNNQLTGGIPSQLGNLSKLQRLELHDNQLSGPIPSQLGNLSNLGTLYLSGNDNLTGCVPAALSDVQNNDFDDLGLDFCSP